MEKTDFEKAWKLFEEKAKKENRSYFSDMVKANLHSLVKYHTPEQAVEKLFKQADRR